MAHTNQAVLKGNRYPHPGRRVDPNMCSVLVPGPCPPVQARRHGYMLLPLEVIVLISEQLLAMDRTNDLAAFSRLESRFAHVIQQILFSHVRVNSYGRYAGLTRTLQSGGQPDRCLELAFMVRHVTAILDPRPIPGEQPFTQNHLLNLYDQLPKLQGVSFGERYHDRLGVQLIPHEEDFDYLETFSTIRSLTLTEPFGSSGHLLLLGLPNLVELRLFGVIAESYFTGPPPRSGLNLRHLTWGVNTPPILRHILWLFADSNENTGGELVLLVAPMLHSELEQICAYAQERGMTFRSPAAPSPALGEF